ncbi:hypothetical protein Slin14017_G063470 [Septoria linicola]|nr:hypothetical protein Slin14017_G063470 [Septoria linicola]
MDEAEEANMRFLTRMIDSPHERHATRYQYPPLFALADSGNSEHVLRGSKSFTARSFRGRQSTSSSLRVPSNRSNNENLSFVANETFPPSLALDTNNTNVLDEIIANGQILRPSAFKPGRSPTPSLKKAAVETLVKSHGSPSHVRVTAGGRIVPSEQSPLCQPRYGYSAMQTNGGLIKFAPNQRYNGRADDLVQATPHDGQIVQDMSGNFHQVVGGKLLPLPIDRDGATMLHCHAPNLNFVSRPSSQGAILPPFGPSAALTGPTSNGSSLPRLTTEKQLTTLEKEYTKLDDELKLVNRNEAVHGRDMPRADRERLFARRRGLVNQMNTVRIAIKDLKTQPPANAPTSPRAMHNRQSISGGQAQLPGFAQGQPLVNGRASAQVHNALFPVSQQGFGAHFGPTPSPEDGIVGSQWFNTPAAMLGAPPSFDGAMAVPFLNSASGMQMPSITAPLPAPIPQADGTHSLAASLADLRIASPDRSRAISIKAPDAKSANGLKSALNPMSPVYRPNATDSKDSAPSANGMQKLSSSVQSGSKSSAATDETVSPIKDLIHSSSISSLGTADFFPNNTRDHSTRQHVYAQSDDKENDDPERETDLSTPVRDAHMSGASDTGNGRAPVAPPGTPVYFSSTATHAPQPGKAAEDLRPQLPTDIANRQAHNVSPKSKREFQFVHEQPAHIAICPSSSPPEAQSAHADAGVPDLASKSRDWLEGYTTGLQRHHFQPACSKDWLDGYCDGLRASASLTAARASTTSLATPHTGSPMKAIARRPSPALPSRSSSKLQPVENSLVMSRSPFETSTRSTDCLKQAVFAPQNENAILTPAANGPHVQDTTHNLGTWAKKPHNAPAVELPGLGYPFPQRSNAADRHSVTSENDADSKVKTVIQDRTSEHLSTTRAGLSPALSTASVISGSIGSGGGAPTPSNRISSLTSIDSSMSYQWPANRVMTPGEWRSAGTSQNTGLVTGFFAQGQYDGIVDVQPLPQETSQLTGGIPGTTQRATDAHARLSSGGRFREESIDRITSPSASPRPMSPSTPTDGTPVRHDSKKSSPRKGPSPTKIKFESLAEKVGIKVTSPTPSEAGDDGAETASPSSKRHWGVRDWIKGNKTSNV